MNLKKKIILGVGLLLLVVAVGVPAFLMFKGISQFGSAKEKLDMTVNSLCSFYKKNPFPTKENITKENKNLDQIHQWFGQLVDVVTAGQIERRDVTPSSFMTQYNQIRNKIVTAANKPVEIVARDNDFGFASYAEGNLPVAVDVPRLMQQMLITERLAMIMIESKVKKINKITREEFDSVSSKESSPRKAASRRRGRGGRRGSIDSTKTTSSLKTIRKTDVYEVQSFSVEFSAKEGVCLDVLNRFSRDDLFIVVTGVEFIKEAKDLKMPKLDVTKGDTGELDVAALKDADSATLVRQQRRVSGAAVDTPMTVRVNLDVYTFFVRNVKALKATSG